MFDSRWRGYSVWQTWPTHNKDRRPPRWDRDTDAPEPIWPLPARVNFYRLPPRTAGLRRLPRGDPWPRMVLGTGALAAGGEAAGLSGGAGLGLGWRPSCVPTPRGGGGEGRPEAGGLRKDRRGCRGAAPTAAASGASSAAAASAAGAAPAGCRARSRRPQPRTRRTQNPAPRPPSEARHRHNSEKTDLRNYPRRGTSSKKTNKNKKNKKRMVQKNPPPPYS